MREKQDKRFHSAMEFSTTVALIKYQNVEETLPLEATVYTKEVLLKPWKTNKQYKLYGRHVLNATVRIFPCDSLVWSLWGSGWGVGVCGTLLWDFAGIPHHISLRSSPGPLHTCWSEVSSSHPYISLSHPPGLLVLIFKNISSYFIFHE